MKHIAQYFGTVTPPQALTNYGTDPGGSIAKLLQVVMWTLIVGSSVYALFKLILSGYSFMSAGGDSQKIAGAWATIWQTMLGLAVAAGAFILAGIFGKLIFNDWYFILNPVIPSI